MKVNRTEQIYIGYNEKVSELCHISKNLYNQANYILRQQFTKRERIPGYSDLAKTNLTQANYPSLTMKR